MGTNPMALKEALVTSPNRKPLGGKVSAVQPTKTRGNNRKAKQPEQPTPLAVQPKGETEFRLSSSPELSPNPAQSPDVLPPETRANGLMSPEAFRKQFEAPLVALVPELERWARLTEEDRAGEWAAIWQKDQLAALGVIAPAMIGAKHMYDVLQVYRPMILKFKDELRINGRPSKDRAQRTWRSIGIDFPGIIGWESACKLIWNATPQYVNQCIRQGGRAARQPNDGNPAGGGATKRRARKADPEASIAATSQAIQTPRALLDAIDRSETFKDALENVFMVDSNAEFASRLQEFAQLLADGFRPRGYRVVVEVQLEKERKGTGRPVPALANHAQGSAPTPTAKSSDSRKGALPAPDPKACPSADLEEPISRSGAEPPIAEAAGGEQQVAGADGDEPAPCPRSKKVYEAFRGGPKVLKVTAPGRPGDVPTFKYFVCSGDQSHPYMALDAAKAACDKIARETPGGARKSPAPVKVNEPAVADPEKEPEDEPLETAHDRRSSVAAEADGGTPREKTDRSRPRKTKTRKKQAQPAVQAAAPAAPRAADPEGAGNDDAPKPAAVPTREPKQGVRVHTATLRAGISRTTEFEKKGLAQFAVNVGTKCGHDCLYCSTGPMLRRHLSFKEAHEDPFESGFAIVDPDTPGRVARDAAREKDRGLIQLSTTVDAWSPEAQKHNLGRRCLEAILPEPDWTVRILTKNAAVMNDFDLIARYRDRILVGLSLTATEDKSRIMSVVEPNASSNTQRMWALQEAHRRGLRTYGMLCPLLPGIADSPDQVDQLVGFVLDCGAEEVFVEPVNSRGRGLGLTEGALRSAGLHEEADAIAGIRPEDQWSAYTRNLLGSVQEALRKRDSLPKLRFLLYPWRLTQGDESWIRSHSDGVKWLGKDPS